MKEFSILNPPPIFIEIGPGSLRLATGNREREWPLERAADGKLTAACRNQLISVLPEFLQRKAWQPKGRALCGISAHGVSLRRVTLPAAGGQELENVLRLQIEKEFPLGPDELAWGWRELARGSVREAMIVAVRKELIEDYTTVLVAAGLNPEFTLSAFARELLCPAPLKPHVILEIGDRQSEWVSFENGVATQARMFPAGDGSLPEALLKMAGTKIVYVANGATLAAEKWGKLSARMDVRCLEWPVAGSAAATSATICGLKKSLVENHSLPWLRTQPKKAKAALDFLRPENRPLLYRAAALLVLLCLLPYGEAWLLKPLLARKLAAFKAERQQFVSVVDPELRFLQALKQSQPPYLDAIYVFSKAAPPGMHMDSLAISQKGDITLKASVQNAQQVMDFRSKLIDSGFFAGLTVEEQTAIQFPPKVSVRMTAQWKPSGSRPVLKIQPTPVDAKLPGAGGRPGPPATAGNHPLTPE